MYAFRLLADASVQSNTVSYRCSAEPPHPDIKELTTIKAPLEAIGVHSHLSHLDIGIELIQLIHYRIRIIVLIIEELSLVSSARGQSWGKRCSLLVEVQVEVAYSPSFAPE